MSQVNELGGRTQQQEASLKSHALQPDLGWGERPLLSSGSLNVNIWLLNWPPFVVQTLPSHLLYWHCNRDMMNGAHFTAINRLYLVLGQGSLGSHSRDCSCDRLTFTQAVIFHDLHCSNHLDYPKSGNHRKVFCWQQDICYAFTKKNTCNHHWLGHFTVM